MSKETSTYLDLLRFSAAFLVLIYHAFGVGITGGFLWQIANYGHTAVLVFFVLSGYVIGFVSHTKETDLTQYLSARFSRLYSIVIPALLITLACNLLGGLYLSDAYTGPWNRSDSDHYLRYITTFFMLQDVWHSNLSPLNNGSFWSLSYEFFYYLFFAAVFYLSGRVRWWVFALLLLAAGPAVASLFPIWGLGYLAYRLHCAPPAWLKPGLAWVLFGLGLLVLVWSPNYREALSLQQEWLPRPTLVGDYIDGIACFIHILAVPLVTRRFTRVIGWIRKPVVFLAGLTFALYLFHLPLVRLFAGVSPFIEQPGSVQNIVFVYAMVLGSVALLGLPAERSKYWYKQQFKRLFGAVVRPLQTP